MKVKIRVTKTDIKRGKANDCLHCPVARAISRELNLLARVYDWVILLGPRDSAKVPISVLKFIWRFDRASAKQRSELKPFSFTLWYEIRQEFKLSFRAS